MTRTIRNAMLSVLLALSCASGLQAQRGAPPPPLLECGEREELEIICGTLAPEDLELTPDERRIFVSQFGRGASAAQAGITLFDPETETFTPVAVRQEAREGWGDPDCTAAPENLGPHGFSLGSRGDGMTALYVVNHAGRESIEMYEVRPAGEGWELVWRGCALASDDYNDVAILPDGGFVGTFPTALQAEGDSPFGGQTTGYLVRWGPDGERRLPGTEQGYPNGVVAGPEGRYAFYAAFAGRAIHKYDLGAEVETDVAALDFMPDNLSWTSEGRLLATGIKGAGGECPEGGGYPCIQGFKIAEIDPESMEILRLYDSAPGPSAISGASIALEFGDVLYVGAFQGDRLVRLRWPE